MRTIERPINRNMTSEEVEDLNLPGREPIRPPGRRFPKHAGKNYAIAFIPHALDRGRGNIINLVIGEANVAAKTTMPPETGILLEKVLGHKEFYRYLESIISPNDRFDLLRREDLNTRGETLGHVFKIISHVAIEQTLGGDQGLLSPTQVMF